MVKTPRVSVITIFKDAERFIEESITSVLNQTSDQWELLLVDDGSTDASSTIARRLAAEHAPKVHYLDHPDHENRGMSASRNLGMGAARGQYIAFLDSDDVWLPDAIERQLSILDRHPEAGMLYGNALYWFGWTGKAEDVSRDYLPDMGVRSETLVHPPELLKILLSGNGSAPCVCSVLIRRETISRVGGFEDSFRGIYEDQVFFAKVCLNVPVFVVDQYWAKYRQHDESACAVALTTAELKFGAPSPTRYAFLTWLKSYLAQRPQLDLAIMSLLERELEQYREPEASSHVLQVTMEAPHSERLIGCSIDLPVPGTLVAEPSVNIYGWVLASGETSTAVELRYQGEVVSRALVDQLRPDVAAAFPDVQDAERCGFHIKTSIVGLMPASLELHAVLADQDRVFIGGVELERKWNVGSEKGPLVSVVIPCFNQAHFLTEAIESAVVQTYPHIEVIVVDDGSTDNTSQIVSHYPGLRCIRQPNLGLAAARNTGLRNTTGEYLVFLDADDRLLEDALRAGLDCFLQHPSSSLVFGRCRLINADGTRSGVEQPIRIEQEDYAALLQGNDIWMPAEAMYRRAAFSEVGVFDSSVDACADYDMYLRIARRFPIACHDSVVSEYRQHPANMSRQSSLMLKSVLTVLSRQQKYVRQSKDHADAYKAGAMHWRAAFGERVVDDLSILVEERKWREAMPGLWTLLRHYPRGFLSLASAGDRQRPPPRIDSGVESDAPPAPGQIKFGSLRRVSPISSAFGYDRGLPIDRYYIEKFLASHVDDIRGHVLEIGDNSYTRKFGADRVSKSDVLHVSRGNPLATIVADLTDADQIPSRTFDCIIFTQTLQLIYDVRAAIRTLHRILKPDGVLLATFPGISQIANDEWGDNWSWAFTPLSARRLFEEAFPAASVSLETHGNVLAAVSFLHGLATEEISMEELDSCDPHYPVALALRAVKAEG
jgi:glycosyltransferase involved in cell wall biosynthesis/SAM-dependent methyltransferase